MSGINVSQIELQYSQIKKNKKTCQNDREAAVQLDLIQNHFISFTVTEMCLYCIYCHWSFFAECRHVCVGTVFFPLVIKTTAV